MFCLTSLENKVLKDHFAAKDAKKKQKSISHLFKNHKLLSLCGHWVFEKVDLLCFFKVLL